MVEITTMVYFTILTALNKFSVKVSKLYQHLGVYLFRFIKAFWFSDTVFFFFPILSLSSNAHENVSFTMKTKNVRNELKKKKIKIKMSHCLRCTNMVHFYFLFSNFFFLIYNLYRIFSFFCTTFAYWR